MTATASVSSTTRHHLGTALAATVASGVLIHFGLGFEPVAVLAWLAPLPVLLLAPRTSAWVASAAAFLAYLGGSAGSWHYFLNSQSIPLPAALAILLGTPVLFAATVALFRRLVRAGRPVLATVAAPALWTAALYGVSLASPFGVMGTFVTSQGDHADVLRLASVLGGWGVEYLVLLAPAALAAVLAPGVRPSARVGITVATAAAVVGTLAFGATPGVGPSGQVRVATVARSEPAWAAAVGSPTGQRVLRSYVDALRALPADVRIAVLPEGAFGIDRAHLADLTAPLADVARDRNLDIVTGAIVTDPGRPAYNTALAVSPAGPTVEYRKWRNGDSPVASGHDLANLTGRPIGLEVCMDVNGPSPTRDYARAGTGLLLIPASDEDVDGWQHSRTALLRGVENGVSVAWSATRGTSFLGDATGHVLAQTRTGSAPVVVATADVPLATGQTLYTRFGDWFAWLCCLLALAGLAFTGRAAVTASRE
ncbi:nitrilase-related carbon-nitrogen hydrolase [Amycolatopsis rhabdoformis]|uniref:Nitrilase-related carbon-nitrogen hydrolase n=1 Tax=Amycolatopsis rhabdoformis TaxID=1448059 RepID=A0ABZ1I791_9PSEU|nr:nitrilase-related carbon-nitrogen hydrolase [Amycolatopsis rhabdoformis]WSE29687.1 nitrilase-related carbon-nitrogen hydrolase [Amycolatopsis rhabdoformis]